LIDPINITESKAKVRLDSREYTIYVLGGWGVKLGDFSITFKNIGNNQLISSHRPIISLVTMANNIRAKKIFCISVPEKGDYKVIFEKSKSLKVYRYNLAFFTTLFQPIPNSEIKILISENNGMLMFKD